MNYKLKKKHCHILTEIYPNLFVGDYDSVSNMVIKVGIDILVPLWGLTGRIWEDGFKGEILYYPINDYDILPINILDKAVNEIIKLLSQNKKVGIFCNGGHGRTGYLAACVLGKLGIRDPIKDLRVRYCSKAIETNKQLLQISEYLNKPELYDKYKEKEDPESYYKKLYESFGFSDFYFPTDYEGR